MFLTLSTSWERNTKTHNARSPRDTWRLYREIFFRRAQMTEAATSSLQEAFTHTRGAGRTAVCVSRLTLLMTRRATARSTRKSLAPDRQQIVSRSSWEGFSTGKRRKLALVGRVNCFVSLVLVSPTSSVQSSRINTLRLVTTLCFVMYIQPFLEAISK